MKSVSRIPINTHLGISHNQVNGRLTMPHTKEISNLWGDVSFCAQFTLAESASAQFLVDTLGLNLKYDIPTLRKAEVKFSKPTKGESIAQVLECTCTSDQFLKILETKGKIYVTIVCEVNSGTRERSISGSFTWLVLRRK